ncbi:hypothetical protein Q0N71_27755 [Bacillus thuringiensis]|uniref:hypothetical protein n=1 Tax=Bacillus thuringiensis TaxID=1428 RepID=UPI00345AFFEB
MIDNQCVNSGENNYLVYCEGCQGEIYFGEDYYDFGGEYLHCETECVKQYIKISICLHWTHKFLIG